MDSEVPTAKKVIFQYTCNMFEVYFVLCTSLCVKKRLVQLTGFNKSLSIIPLLKPFVKDV